MLGLAVYDGAHGGSDKSCSPPGGGADYDKYMCKICVSEEVNILFRPCLHVCVCLVCSHKVNTCPLCRKNITEKIKFVIGWPVPLILLGLVF